ncbi:alpha/beta hydrolase [Roseobacter weihaiensis]|uniref:alpha/beta hydrolase n=1 Tax=Roseobacter weihaiensis TaxID=2763262 RepID=UPI001D0B0566|nr:alpha/beta hydrolase [Roseobacter sp. H9]
MQTRPKRDWDDAFANSAHIDGADRLPALWQENAVAYRDSGVAMDVDLSYGAHPREKFDLVWPDSTPKGLAIFVHGGYWIATDKSYWTDLAEGARANGWAVALPQYTLAPEARIAEITSQIGAAISKAATLVSGPVRIAGHSAGGHLVSRMACADSPLSEDAQKRLDHTLSISGLHDLRPLIWTEMNKDLRLDEAEALRESPALLQPCRDANVTVWVGGGERPEFIRQANLLALMWDGLEAEIACVVDGDHNHFSVLDSLKDPDSALTKVFAE